MLFTTGEFLFVYLPVALLLFFLLARVAGERAAAVWLVVASLAFYAYWRADHTLLLIGSIAFNYGMGRRIASADERRRGALLRLAVAVNLLVLAWFKYANFFLRSYADIAGRPVPVLAIALPLGISFFTFTQIAYLVDVARGKVRETKATHYALFVTYFPHLVAGPILHHAEMMPQFAKSENYRPHLRNLALGLSFLGIGLAKKVLIADTVAPMANLVFEQASQAPLTMLSAWEGVLAYTTQIYFDFSGYSDMAIGLSLFLGIRLPYNFNSPYKARSISDFWRRWHITLSRFLRDYLYIPLGGNRQGRVRRYVNLMLTMLLGGLWHGAAWTFVVWGGLHGGYLIVNHAWRWLRGTGDDTSASTSFLERVAYRALTLIAVMVAWVFFRAPDVQSALGIVASMFVPSGHASATFRVSEVAWLIGFFALALLGPNSQEILDGRFASFFGRESRRWQYRHVMLLGAGAVFIVMFAITAASRTVTEFIYFNF